MIDASEEKKRELDVQCIKEYRGRAVESMAKNQIDGKANFWGQCLFNMGWKIAVKSAKDIASDLLVFHIV